MVAYSFQPQFVTAIKVGLGTFAYGVTPKRQTIRSRGLKRHAMPGDTLQLYCRQRHPLGFKIGEARCVRVSPIRLIFRHVNEARIDPLKTDYVDDGEFTRSATIASKERRDAFARRDGFADWQALRNFWREHHASIFDERGTGEFSGLLIEWEPIT